MEDRITPIHPTPERGLSFAQAEERKAAGLNAGEPVPAGKTEKEIILSHCFTFFNLIFLVLAVLLIIARSSIMNMGFLIVISVNTVLGIVQELRAKRAVDALVLVSRHPVTVIREGKRLEVDPADIVRDDIAEFAQGDQLCADGILRSGELNLDESQLTGESDIVVRRPGDRVSSGSVVLSGRGRVELTAVGENSAAAALSREAKKDPKAAKSEMMRSLDRLILFVGIMLVPVGAILFRQEFYVLKLGFKQSTQGTVAALIGMIPEGLYLLTSVALAVSARKLSAQKVLVQDRNCIETLARVDVLCVDKTGTITEPNMEVSDVLPLTQLPPEELQDILTALYGGQEPDNATAKAMSELFSGRSSWECTKRVPFSSDYKWSGASFRDQGSFVVGAPEYLLGSRMEDYAETVSEWTEQGLRVLMAAAYGGELFPGTLDSSLVEPLALILLGSRLRPGAKDTFAYFAEQGVRIIVISGDNPATASQIALSAGIAGAENWLDASRLETEEDYREAVESCTVFGRVTPDQKRRLIAAFQEKKHTVAMTGDGVNDLLAMKQADCSIAMASGTQAASQMASIVLLDSDFAAMPGIVAEGRRVINNIQRSASLFLVKNIFSLFLSVISLFTAWPYPLEPIHFTVISNFTIGIPSFLLTLEPRYDRVRGKFLPGVLRRAFPGGLTNVFVVLLCQAFMVVFGLNSGEGSTACAAILSFVGLLVLFQICKPFDRFRALVWSLMVLGVIGCFVFLGDLLTLRVISNEARLVMFTLLVMTPTVFFTIQRIFDWVETGLNRLKNKIITLLRRWIYPA